MKLSDRIRNAGEGQKQIRKIVQKAEDKYDKILPKFLEQTEARVGIEDKWEPTQEEMLAVQDALMAAEEDPVGAKLVFRNGVELDQIGGHTEIAKLAWRRAK